MPTAVQKRLSPRPTLLVFEISAKITKPDIEQMAEEVGQAFDTYGQIDMLLIVTDFEGMDPEAAFDREALAAQVRSVKHVRKYGVVGAPGWARAMIEVLDFLSPVDAKTFNLTDEAQAWEWIGGETPV